MSNTSDAASAKQPAFERIKTYLRNEMDQGDLAEGARVPSEHELAKQFGVSRNQTRQALRELELEGYVIRRQGSGSFVAPRNAEVATISPTNTGAVVMIFPQYMSGYCRQVIEGFMCHMSETENQTITYNWQREPEAELQLLRTISDSGVAGLVAWIENDDEETRALVRELRDRSFPIVLVDRYLEDVEVDSVHSDNVEIGYRLTKALIEQGHRRIVFAGLFEALPSSHRNRLKGYQRALEEAGIPYDERLVAVGEEQFANNPLTFVKSYMALADRPTAFVCVHDLIAKLIYDPLIDLGYRVPEDITLAAVDDGRPPHRSDIPLITVKQNAFEIGARSAAVLLERMKNKDKPPQRCQIAPSDQNEIIQPSGEAPCPL